MTNKYLELAYKEALIAAHNGTANKIYFRPVYTTDDNGQKVLSHLEAIVDYNKDGKSKVVKIGILRAVSTNKTGTEFYPNRHQSGFSNKLVNRNTNDEKLEEERNRLFNLLDENPSTIENKLEKIENTLEKNNEELKKLRIEFIESLEIFGEQQVQRNRRN